MGERGVAIIMAMWLLAVLAIIGATFVYMMRLEPIIARTHRDDMKARHVAQAGIDMAVYKLRGDADLTIDSFKEDWATYFSGSDVDNNGDGTADSRWITLTDEDNYSVGYYAALINDEAGKVSLNNPLTDNSPWKNLLDGLSMSAATAQKVIDYQAGTYGPFETIDELACVYGISEDGYSAYFRKAKVHHQNFPTNPTTTRLPINVNTASEEVLRAALGELTGSTYAILKVTNTNIDRVVTAILAYRAGADGIERTADDNPFDGVDSYVGDDNDQPDTDETRPFNIQDIDLDPGGGSFGSAQDEFNEFINYVRKWGYPNITAGRIAEKSITYDYVRDNIKDNFDPATEYDNWDSNNPTTPDVNDDDAAKEILAADETYTTSFSFNNSPTGPPQSKNNQFFEIISTGKYVSPSGHETLKRIRIIINRGKETPAVEGKIWYYKEISEE